MNKKNSLFTIHLMEDEDGHVVVMGEFVGEGERAFSLGLDILEGLRTLENYGSTGLTVQTPVMSDYFQ